MFGRDIEEEMRHGIDGISRRGSAGDDHAGGGPWQLAGGRGGAGGADLFSLLFMWLDAVAGLFGAILAALRRA